MVGLVLRVGRLCVGGMVVSVFVVWNFVVLEHGMIGGGMWKVVYSIAIFLKLDLIMLHTRE